MNQFRILFLSLVLIALPTASLAYIGAGIGVVDEDHFGYALVFGAQLPLNFGLDFQVVSFADTGTPDNYWVQGNADLSYDFNSYWKKVSETIELHPYVKGGFTYGASLLDSSGIDIQASHGPGFNFGGGVDWKILGFITVGVDFTETIAHLDGISVAGITLPDKTAKVFTVLGLVKFFAY
ncbi:MAG TPA: hypothetical protein VI895_03315 [Bdellovibrionota bacterium]|nr:hypothetical protein [Bdellovibrionota bacterium]